MSRRARLIFFAMAASGFGVVLVFGLAGLPDFGDYHGVYGKVISGLGVDLRHATDLVTAINFDFRAFDTLGEEFLLFTSVLGIALILREMREEQVGPSQEESDEHTFAGASEALRAMVLVLIPVLVAVGIYIAVHGHLTPGGGFQAGVVLAAGPLGIFLGGRYLRMKAIAPHAVTELGEAAGAAGYALLGLSGLVFVGTFFQNPLPLGTPGHLLSAGQIPVASILVGLEVSGAFLIAWGEFLDQAMLIRGGMKP
jgi:multicomponent Na+:H+ antiporter subunit B